MKENTLKKRDYSLIPEKTKRELIELVEKQNYPIRIAGQLLKVKLSRAKVIVKKYRQEKKSKIERKNDKKTEQGPQIEQKPSQIPKKDQPVKIENTEQNQREQSLQQVYFPDTNFMYGLNYPFWQYLYLLNNFSYQ